MKILIINGPNLNTLGRREPSVYGTKSLEDIEGVLREKAKDLDVELEFFQSNSEGALIDYLQSSSSPAAGIVINPGALTHYGLSLADTLAGSRLPVIEVHLSNIYSREEWRKKSVVAPIAVGQISGLGWRGYVYALEFLADHLKRGGLV